MSCYLSCAGCVGSVLVATLSQWLFKGRIYSGEVDTYVNEQEIDAEEGGATLEDDRPIERWAV